MINNMRKFFVIVSFLFFIGFSFAQDNSFKKYFESKKFPFSIIIENNNDTLNTNEYKQIPYYIWSNNLVCSDSQNNSFVINELDSLSFSMFAIAYLGTSKHEYRIIAFENNYENTLIYYLIVYLNNDCIGLYEFANITENVMCVVLSNGDYIKIPLCFKEHTGEIKYNRYDTSSDNYIQHSLEYY